MKKYLLSIFVSQFFLAVHSQIIGESWKISYMESASGKYAAQTENLPPFEKENLLVLGVDGEGKFSVMSQSGTSVATATTSIEKVKPVYICMVQDGDAPLDSVNKVADMIHAYFIKHSSAQNPVLFYRKVVDFKNMAYSKVVDIFENNLDFYQKKDISVPINKHEYKPVILYGANGGQSQGMKVAAKRNPNVLLFERSTFMGGEVECDRWITENLVYPHKCRDKGIQGLVVVICTVDTDGGISGVKAIQSSHKLFAKEAVRLVRQMPRWVPAKVNGQEVKSVITIPVQFSLE